MPVDVACAATQEDAEQHQNSEEEKELKSQLEVGAAQDIDAAISYESDNSNTYRDNNPNISAPSKEEYVNPFEAASQEFDRKDVNKTGKLDWDVVAKLVIESVSELAWVIRKQYLRVFIATFSMDKNDGKIQKNEYL